ncbi:MAG: AAA family ATPase [Betaproteobacteria bacterium]|nr:AAA family ATPase [Betaproteobacteria bacterium]
MSDTLASLSSALPSSLHHDSWFAALTDRMRAAVLARHRVVVTELLRLRVDLARWQGWFEARADWSLYLGADHLGRTVALGFDGASGTSVRLKRDLSVSDRAEDRLHTVLALGEHAYAAEAGQADALYPGEVTVLGAPASVREVAAQLRAAFAPAGSTVHWVYGEHGQSVTLPLREDLRPLETMFPFLERPLADYYDAYASSSAAILLLIGPPGTGKTSFIRGLLQHGGHDAMVSLDPKLLDTDVPLTEFLTSDADVFVLEDADALLTSRAQGNTLMHRLLSVSDGLVTLAGKKLMFSTNLDSPAEVDPALLRPGRCFDVLRFRLLEYREAYALAQAAGVTAPSDPARRYSAAEVFHAGETGRGGPRSLRRPVGFV